MKNSSPTTGASVKQKKLGQGGWNGIVKRGCGRGPGGENVEKRPRDLFAGEEPGIAVGFNVGGDKRAEGARTMRVKRDEWQDRCLAGSQKAKQEKG